MAPYFSHIQKQSTADEGFNYKAYRKKLTTTLLLKKKSDHQDLKY